MRKFTLLILALLAGVLSFAGTGSAEAAEDFWSGPYLGFTSFGWASGTATFQFNSDGPYNTAPGDMFTLALPENELGSPIIFMLGYNWRRGSSPLVFGVEASFATREVRVDDASSPPSIHAGNHEYDVKTHWLATITARAGLTRGPFMVYVEAGPAVGHPVAEIRDLDNNYDIWTPRAQLGLTAGAGFQVALGPSLSVGLGYRAYALTPLHVTGVSFDRTTGDPVPGTETDHTVQLAGHSVTARLIYRFGQSERLRNWEEPFDWGGFYLGNYAGALHQIGMQAGYDWTFGRGLAGVSGQAGIAICCGLSFDFAASARAGWLVHDAILAYGEITAAYQTGTFFGVVDGFYYGAGAGIEVALAPRVTGFMELKLMGSPATGLTDAAFQGGFNFHLGQR